MIEPAPLFLHRVVDCSRWKQMSLSGTEVATRTGMILHGRLTILMAGAHMDKSRHMGRARPCQLGPS